MHTFFKIQKTKIRFPKTTRNAIQNDPQKAPQSAPTKQTKCPTTKQQSAPQKGPLGAPSPRPPRGGNIVEGAFRSSRHRPNGPPTLFATLLKLCLQLCLRLCCRRVPTRFATLLPLCCGPGEGPPGEDFGAAVWVAVERHSRFLFFTFFKFVIETFLCLGCGELRLSLLPPGATLGGGGCLGGGGGSASVAALAAAEGAPGGCGGGPPSPA